MTRKPHRITFPMDSLDPVRSGDKTCTIRLSQKAATIQRGDTLALCFGRYDRPVIVEATCTRAERFDLEPELHRAFDLPSAVDSLIAERRFYQQTKEPDANTSVVLLEAIQASGGSYEALLGEAAARDTGSTHCVWFSIEKVAV